MNSAIRFGPICGMGDVLSGSVDPAGSMAIEGFAGQTTQNLRWAASTHTDDIASSGRSRVGCRHRLVLYPLQRGIHIVAEGAGHLGGDHHDPLGPDRGRED